MTNFNPSNIDWSNACFMIVAPSGNYAIAKSRTNATQLAVQISWRTDPSDEDVAFSQEAIKALLPNACNSMQSHRAANKADSERAMNAYLNAVNN